MSVSLGSPTTKCFSTTCLFLTISSTPAMATPQKQCWVMMRDERWEMRDEEKAGCMGLRGGGGGGLLPPNHGSCVDDQLLCRKTGKAWQIRSQWREESWYERIWSTNWYWCCSVDLGCGNGGQASEMRRLARWIVLLEDSCGGGLLLVTYLPTTLPTN